MFLVAQILGLFAMICLVISYQYNKKENVLIWQMGAAIFWIIMFILLESMVGTITSYIALLRIVVFYRFEQSNQKVPKSMLIIINLLFITTGILYFKTWFDVLPIIANLLFNYSWQKDLKTFRQFNLAIVTCWLIFNLNVHAFSSFMTNIFELCSTSLAIYRFDINKKKSKLALCYKKIK